MIPTRSTVGVARMGVTSGILLLLWFDSGSSDNQGEEGLLISDFCVYSIDRSIL